MSDSNQVQNIITEVAKLVMSTLITTGNKGDKEILLEKAGQMRDAIFQLDEYAGEVKLRYAIMAELAARLSIENLKGIADIAFDKNLTDTIKVDEISKILASENGDAVVLYSLGIGYAKGRGVETSLEKAAAFFTEAAEKGFSEAQYNLGICYNKGYGVERCAKTAAKWWQEAANQGDGRAWYNLGVLYEKGDGVIKCDETAIECLEKAAAKGIAQAQTVLADKKKESPAARFESLKKEAEQGNADAQYNLALHYLSGEGVGQNEQAGVKLLMQASEGGNTEAQKKLDEIAEYTAANMVLEAPINIVDKILDADNDELLEFFVNGAQVQEVKFEQVASILFDDKKRSFVMLRPVGQSNENFGLDEDEAFIFEMLKDEEQGKVRFSLVKDRATEKMVYKEYLRLFKAAKKAKKKKDKIKNK